MERYRVTLFAVCICIVVSACKKGFLEVSDKSVLLTEQYVTDLKTTGQYLYGTYIRLTEFFHGYQVTYPELIADNIKPVLGSQLLSPHYHWTQQAETTSGIIPSTASLSMNTLWNTGYKLIRHSNFVIEKSEKYKNENLQTANDYKAQAFFLRAMIHLTLVNVFAQSHKFTPDASHQGIPYVKVSDWTTVPTGRQTVAEVYNFIVDDLQNALALFAGNSDKIIYANRNAAKALLARTYLYMEKYELARNLAIEIAQQVPLMTIASGYPNGLFKKATQPNTELLFHLPPGVSGGSSGYAGRYYQGSSSSIKFSATEDIATLLTENSNDARKVWVSFSSGKWTITKFPSGLVSGVSPATAAYYQPVIRSSEMYLTAAEAYAWLDIEDSARLYLDAIRLRADPAAAPSTASGTALLDSIYSERRKEFAFEGFRMFDLQRWKLSVNREDALNPNAQHLPYPSNKAIAPIPLLDVQEYELQQNDGY